MWIWVVMRERQIGSMCVRVFVRECISLSLNPRPPLSPLLTLDSTSTRSSSPYSPRSARIITSAMRERATLLSPTNRRRAWEGGGKCVCGVGCVCVGWGEGGNKACVCVGGGG